jgi:hypothetical protein
LLTVDTLGVELILVGVASTALFRLCLFVQRDVCFVRYCCVTDGAINVTVSGGIDSFFAYIEGDRLAGRDGFIQARGAVTLQTTGFIQGKHGSAGQ